MGERKFTTDCCKWAKKKGCRCNERNEQTLIYCFSPNTARSLAFSCCTHLISNGIQSNIQLPLIEWINTNLTFHWSLAKCLQFGIAVHDGAMPKHITSSTIQYFNQKKITYLFCTNTIIEGVNTSAKNVIYYDDKAGSKKIDFSIIQTLRDAQED